MVWWVKLAKPMPLLRQLGIIYGVLALGLVVMNHSLGLFEGDHLIKAFPGLVVDRDDFCLLQNRKQYWSCKNYCQILSISSRLNKWTLFIGQWPMFPIKLLWRQYRFHLKWKGISYSWLWTKQLFNHRYCCLYQIRRKSRFLPRVFFSNWPQVWIFLFSPRSFL